MDDFFSVDMKEVYNAVYNFFKNNLSQNSIILIKDIQYSSKDLIEASTKCDIWKRIKNRTFLVLTGSVE